MVAIVLYFFEYSETLTAQLVSTEYGFNSSLCETANKRRITVYILLFNNVKHIYYYSTVSFKDEKYDQSP